MNSLNPIETSLLTQDQDPLTINDPNGSPASPYRLQPQSEASELLTNRKRVISIKKRLTANTISNHLFILLLWFGLFSGTTSSTYLTLMRSDDRPFSSFFPLLVVISYFQVPYCFIGIYAHGEKESSVMSWLRTLSICNFIGLILVEAGILANILGINHSSDTNNAELLAEIFDHVTLSCLIGIPCHAITIYFITKKSWNHWRLLKEKERLQRRILQIRGFVSVMQNNT